ncbi:hypothetical protein C0J52_03429 [Blattella germanica]|nr:hypothetical protein C0J52_03429 [Blattella germanica]
MFFLRINYILFICYNKIAFCMRSFFFFKYSLIISNTTSVRTTNIVTVIHKLYNWQY